MSSELQTGLYLVSFIPLECWNRIVLANKCDAGTDDHCIKGVVELGCVPVRMGLWPAPPGHSPHPCPRKEAPIPCSFVEIAGLGDFYGSGLIALWMNVTGLTW